MCLANVSRGILLQLKVWISLLIPRIEDGNNFGVSIQVGLFIICMPFATIFVSLCPCAGVNTSNI